MPKYSCLNSKAQIEGQNFLKMALIYVRFSPRRFAAESRTLEVQEASCRKYCADHGLEVFRVLADPETSARKRRLLDRPNGRIIQELVDTRQIAHVVVSRLDRLFRSVIDGLSTRSWLLKRRVSLHMADQGGVALCANSAEGRFVFSQLLTVAEFEPDLIAQRTSQAILARQKKGIVISYRPRFGQQIKNNRLVPNLDERAIIHEIMEMYNRGMTTVEIAKDFRRRKVKCRTRAFRSDIVRIIIQRELESNV